MNQSSEILLKRTSEASANSASHSKNIFPTFLETGRILVAVALIDMKTRFGGSFLSYLIAIAWPLSHMGFLMVGFLLTTKIAPIGDDPAIFAGSGLLPYILCMYPARMTAYAIIQNKFLLNIQVIKPVHLLFGRMMVEILSALTVCIIFYSTLLLVGVPFLPLDMPSAMGAILASIYLGIGLGSVNVLMASLMGPFTVIIFVLILLGAYITAGILIPIARMNDVFKQIAQANPIYHCVAWFRSTYYTAATNDDFSISFILIFSSVCLMIGLAGERYMRGKYT